MDKPVSRQHERDYYRYYGYPYYWGYSGLWGMGAYPGLLAAGRWNDAPGERIDETRDVHLGSASEVRGDHIQGSDEMLPSNLLEKMFREMYAKRIRAIQAHHGIDARRACEEGLLE